MWSPLMAPAKIKSVGTRSGTRRGTRRGRERHPPRPRAKTGHWVIPGGKAEPGETPRRCAVREAREETGLDGRPGRLLAVQHLTADRGWGSKYIADPYELFVFALHVDCGQHAGIRVPDGELLGWAWFTPDDGVKLMDPTNAALFTATVQAVRNGTCAHVEDTSPGV
ncbi:NUDIX domain-containing protein [Streptomyces sp. NPDC053048]|uniref:NUDIX domain-containing protein n=1 Tax=Streptomyces sp. NPDC053048 TaxID=3365694 RepID=UPI0037D37BD7